jgi:tetratricopeptide (TPR) repeat protein
MDRRSLDARLADTGLAGYSVIWINSMNRCLLLLLSLGFLVLVACGKQEQSAAPATLPFDLVNTPVGDVSFPVGCNADAAPLVERGVALLHHMMYDEAKFVFGMADDRDPDCAMAYWGQAMSLIHPLWPDVPTASQFERGLKAVERSLMLSGHSDRENAYLQTTRAYFEGGEHLTERQRLVKFEKAWEELSQAFPKDLEARAFYSLALRSTADMQDKTLATQKKAGAIAESVLTEMPNHPGAHHYIIHAYDSPALAEMALVAANHYGEITPRVPHATHMMTHIYTRLGQWEKAVEWNTISADAAWDLCLQFGEINVHYTHALDYLAYAYLQIGKDREAGQVLKSAEQLQPPYSETSRSATAYAFAALPARYALERRDWEAAVKLEPRNPSSFPWVKAHDQYVAITHFARALAMSNLGRPDDATADIEALRALRMSVASESPYWAQQIEIQELSAQAWQDFSRGEVELAIAVMQQAAALEASTDKHAVTPGEVLPAVELYGDMLLEAGRYEEALAAYRTALQRAPLRLNSLYGAGKAALGVGDDKRNPCLYEDRMTL